MIQNPIIRGFYPDPSICRVGEDYYLVTSSFSFFPGVPVFHSRDLMHWEQIGHVLDRPEQLHVTYEDLSLGIFAPAIRYHDGLFYMITTNMTTHENFFCTAEDPAGPWSDPVVIRDAGGIDPSLFWDEDGTAYYTGTAPWNDSRFDHPMIVCSEIDLTTGQLVGEMWGIGDGAAKGAHAPEAPHLYKKDGWYYLLIAEGGTEHNHAVTVSRSRDLRQPFEQCPSNPILTHRHLGRDYPICNVGHADLVECQDGSWYGVCLATRLVDGYHKLLGRETFLFPVEWEDGWPVCSPGTGKVEWTYPAPAFADEREEPAFADGEDVFVDGVLGMDWNFLGTPYEDFVRVEPGKLSLRMLKTNLVPWEFEGEVFDFFGHMMKLGRTRCCMPFVGKRLHESEFELETVMEVAPHGRESAGIVILQNNSHQIRLECAADDEGLVCFRAIRVTYGLPEGKMHYEETVEGEVHVPVSSCYHLRMIGGRNRYDLAVCAKEGGWQTVAAQVDGTHLGTEASGGFVGAYVGVFASGNGVESDNEAAFRKFVLREVR